MAEYKLISNGMALEEVETNEIAGQDLRCMKYWISSYHPLCCNLDGARAASQFAIPPFVDGSIRREPDLEHEHPSISALCRLHHFAPKLKEGDWVAYFTVDGPWGRRITTILEIVHAYDSHDEAAEWYREQAEPLPHNCIVDSNPPLGLDQSNRQRVPHSKAPKTLEGWAKEYEDRRALCGAFRICRVIERNLVDPPRVSREFLHDVFGRVPGTQTPSGKYSAEQFAVLRSLF